MQAGQVELLKSLQEGVAPVLPGGGDALERVEVRARWLYLVAGGVEHGPGHAGFVRKGQQVAPLAATTCIDTREDAHEVGH